MPTEVTRRRAATASLALMACAALTSCSGGRSAGLLPAQGLGDTANEADAARTTGTLRIVVRVPRPAARGAHYVSPSTKSMRLVIAGGKHPIRRTIELAPGSSGCTSASGASTCVEELVIATGSYEATISTFDEVKGKGALLSQGVALPFVIRDGKTKLLNLALEGVPRALTVTGAAGGIHGSSAHGYTLYGTGPLPFVITATDADGNTIVGPGSPSYIVAAKSGSGWSATNPSSSAPNVFTVTPRGTNGSISTITVTVPARFAACAQKHAVCTSSFAVTNDVQHLFVLTSKGVSEYTTPVAGKNPKPMPLAINDLNEPVQMAMDAAGNFYVANCESTCGLPSPDSVTIYGPPATTGTGPTTPTATITNGISNPFSIAVSPAGVLFVGNDNGTVTAYTAPFSNASVPAFTISANLGAVEALTFDTAGHLFVGSCGTSCSDASPDAVYEYAAPYTGSPIATITSGLASPWTFAFAPSGSLFVGNEGTSASKFTNAGISGFTPPFSGVTPVTIKTPGIPYGLAFDRSGDLFVANCGTGCTVPGATDDSLLEYVPPYTAAPLVIDTSLSKSGDLLRPQAVAIDGFGNVMSGNTYDSNFTIYAPPYTSGPASTAFMSSGPTQFILTP